MNQGLIYVPYIMVQNIQVISEGDFTPSATIKSRYAQKIVNAGLYGTFGINLPHNKRKQKIQNMFPTIE